MVRHALRPQAGTAAPPIASHWASRDRAASGLLWLGNVVVRRYAAHTYGEEKHSHRHARPRQPSQAPPRPQRIDPLASPSPQLVAAGWASRLGLGGCCPPEPSALIANGFLALCAAVVVYQGAAISMAAVSGAGGPLFLTRSLFWASYFGVASPPPHLWGLRNRPNGGI